jgi:RNA polymerase sigma-70 factor (ECF subfamily)
MQDPHPGHPVFPSSTSSSLLQRLRSEDKDAWDRLVDLYGPVVRAWCRRGKLQPADSADVFQEVFRSVLTGIKTFRRERSGSFRAWLRTITRNKVHDHFRRAALRPAAEGGSDAQRQLEQAPDPDADLDICADTDEKIGLLRRALAMIRGDFKVWTWQAFWRLTMEGHATADIAQDLGISTASVYQAKARVLRRLRATFDDLLD